MHFGAAVSAWSPWCPGLRLSSCHIPSLHGVSRVCSHLLVLVRLRRGLLGAGCPSSPAACWEHPLPAPLLQVSGSGPCAGTRALPSVVVELAGDLGRLRWCSGSRCPRQQQRELEDRGWHHGQAEGGWAGLGSIGLGWAAQGAPWPEGEPSSPRPSPSRAAGGAPTCGVSPQPRGVTFQTHHPCGHPALWWTPPELALNPLSGLLGGQPCCFILGSLSVTQCFSSL